MPTDRHGRQHRSRDDVRRGPPDGFRVATTDRFRRLVGDAVALLPTPLRRAAAGAEVVVVAVPPDPPLGEVPLATYTRGRGPGRLTVYRRPLELRATSRPDLVELLRSAVGHAIAEETGLPFDNDEDDW